MTNSEKAVVYALVSALQDFIHDEIAREASGDCGSYDVEAQTTVIQGRAALAQVKPEMLPKPDLRKKEHNGK